MVFSGIGSNGSAFPFSRAFTRSLSNGLGAGNGFRSINSQSNFIGNSGRFSGLGNFGTGNLGNLTSLLNQIASNPAFTQSLSQNRLGSQSSTSGIVSLITQLVNQITQLLGVGNNTNTGNSARFVDGSDGPFDPNSVGGFGRNAFSNRQDLINQGLFNPATTTLRYTDRSNPNLNDLFGFSEEAINQNDLNGNGNLSFSEYSQGFSDPNEARVMFQALDRRAG
ncbi:MAG: hypothetical protein K2X66_15175 [Cyanobacteria bacterium]|nr:hypothetical protein [Cyanobacteriota bacterium]